MSPADRQRDAALLDRILSGAIDRRATRDARARADRLDRAGFHDEAAEVRRMARDSDGGPEDERE